MSFIYCCVTHYAQDRLASPNNCYVSQFWGLSLGTGLSWMTFHPRLVLNVDPMWYSAGGRAGPRQLSSLLELWQPWMEDLAHLSPLPVSTHSQGCSTWSLLQGSQTTWKLSLLLQAKSSTALASFHPSPLLEAVGGQPGFKGRQNRSPLLTERR